MLNLALVTVGESVLDVGCGTGTLAIAAKRRVGAAGKVYGVDASQEMLTRAEKFEQQGLRCTANRIVAKVPVIYESTTIPRLPQAIDVVLA